MKCSSSGLNICLALLPAVAFLSQSTHAEPDRQNAPQQVADVHLNAAQVNSEHSNDPSWAKFASNRGDLIFLAAGTLLPLATDGKDGKQHTLRTVDALLASTLISSALKGLTHEERPDGSDYRSFPSGHASAAFTIAMMQAHFHPRQALLWYGGAAIIGASRVALDKHYAHDVIAGAALGFFASRLELKQTHGLLLRPFVHGNSKERVAGLSFSGSF